MVEEIIPHFGTCEIVFEVEGLKSKELFYVTKVNGPAIIGYETSKKLGLITIYCPVITNEQTSNKYQSSVIYDKKDMIAKYPSCFNGIGKFQGQYKITLDPHVPPVVHPHRRIPYRLKDDIKKGLDEMEKLDIIKKVREGEPTQRVNSLVCRRKPNGRLRICLDPKDLNEAIKRDHHVTPPPLTCYYLN